MAACAAQADPLRIAYFHSELSRDGPGLLLRDILKGDPQVEAWLRIVAHADADVLVIGDIDYDLQGVALSALATRLEDYSYQFLSRPNRGLHGGRDLDADGRLGGAGDAEGFGTFAGQGGMAVLSRYPIEVAAVQDFSAFHWSYLPEALDVGDGHDPKRLSTTVHWIVPIELPNCTNLSLMTWHATAPVFDGPEDRNGRRNHDETLFWRYFIEGTLSNQVPERFVLLGTANADPNDGESRPEAIRQLLSHHLVQDPGQASQGAFDASVRDGGVNVDHLSPAAQDTVDWPDGRNRPGNLRVDYVLPARTLSVVDGGVVWPSEAQPFAADAAQASRHRLVWVDIDVGNACSD
ncbi:MAG: endonuclease/exonuclease/phosphatase family protein [Pseudomonadota bacterium]